jgi:ABC-type sulfate transport system permease component
VAFALERRPEELPQAAMIDGATRLQNFRKITLPPTKPALLAAAFFARWDVDISCLGSILSLCGICRTSGMCLDKEGGYDI